ncbi:unnamed protein product [Blepharisma stoltei]|uniref:LITAF domain-containing protein n=1 Tax=Blepharisma stoltei TaxID=1481888 RepID=A0AAU9JGB6_9CILI|nr:unnamed protein product [Blepharisma stoltei]
MSSNYNKAGKLNQNSRFRRELSLQVEPEIYGNYALTPSPRGPHLPSGGLTVFRKGENLILTPDSPLRYQRNFNVDDVTGSLSIKQKEKPFKVLNYKDESHHTRSSTTIINEDKQAYHFISALSAIPETKINPLPSAEADPKTTACDLDFLDISDDIISNLTFPDLEEPKEKEISRPKPSHTSKSSMFASTSAPKSLQTSMLHEIPTLNKDFKRTRSNNLLSSERSTKSFQSDKFFPETFKSNSTFRLTTNTIESEESIDSKPPEFQFERSIANTGSFPDIPLGILPTTAYCHHCQSEVTTTVKICMPTLPLWKRICCASFLGEEELEKYQEFEHYCKNCKKLITKYQPKKLW